LLEHDQLIEAVNHHVEAVARRDLELFRARHAFEQQDPMTAPGCAEHKRFLDARDREAIRIGERCSRGLETVAIGVRLDDCHDARPGREFAHPRQVVPQRGGVDECAGWGLHVCGLPAAGQLP
jgi:hypothetical protein